jgi:leucyl aminopeptidase
MTHGGKMTFSSQPFELSRVKADCLVFPVFEGRVLENFHLKKLPKKVVTQISLLYENEIFVGKNGQNYLLKVEGISAFPFMLLIGLGEKNNLKSDAFRKLGGYIASGLKATKFKRCDILIPPAFKLGKDISAISQTIVEGISLGSYELTRYKSKPVPKSFPLKFNFLIPVKWDKVLFNKGLKIGDIMAWGQNLSRDLIGHPSNYLTPAELAKTAKFLARKYGFSCKILTKADITRLKMNCVLAVNAGSKLPPHFIEMKYNGAGGKKAPICLVGKGITFDSGGISLKPALDMDQMKGDMGGAACVISAITVAARLKLPINLVALVPTTENMPSGTAYKPGDVITAMNGKTVEVLNTDAEGRLILADALAYAQRFKPAAIIDAATLTGAAIVALGYISSALFVNDEKLRGMLHQAAEKSGEKVWEMPLWNEYREQIKSSIADIKNTGGRPAGSCTAAAFLSHFTGDYPWAHIDMAAMDIEFKGGPYSPKGSSGYGVRLVAEFLRSWK